MQITTTFIAGQVLLWLGFLGGSLASVFRFEDPAAPWQTIPWGQYLISAAIGVAGIILLRRDKATRNAQSAASETGLESVRRELAAAAERVSELKSNLEDFTCEEVLAFIDDKCVTHLAEFADGRMVLAHRFGSSVYATIMTEFASGERYLNRAWSAAADGYVDEVEACVDHAHTFFQAAVQHLQTAE